MLKAANTAVLGAPKPAKKRTARKVNLASYSPAELKRLMKEAGMRQVDLAAKAGMNQANISNFLRGEFNPREEDLRKLGRALNVIFIADWVNDEWEKETPRYQKQQGE